MDDYSKQLITNEVIDFFLRGDEALVESFKKSEIFSYAVWDTISKNELSACEEKEFMDRGVQRQFENLLFLTKAKLLLPKIFNISQEDCIAGIKDSLRKARCELILKDKFLDPKQAIEYMKSTWAKERTKNRAWEDCFTHKEKLDRGKEEYQRSRKQIDEAPDYAFGHGYTNPKLDASLTYVADYEKELKKFEYNEAALKELDLTEDELCLSQDGYIISPSIFKKHNLGFDLSTLKFTDEFARAYAIYIDFAKTSISSLQGWEKELCRKAGKAIKRPYKKKIGEPDKYGNVQVSIFNNPDSPNFNEESE